MITIRLNSLSHSYFSVILFFLPFPFIVALHNFSRFILQRVYLQLGWIEKFKITCEWLTNHLVVAHESLGSGSQITWEWLTNHLGVAHESLGSGSRITWEWLTNHLGVAHESLKWHTNHSRVAHESPSKCSRITWRVAHESLGEWLALSLLKPSSTLPFGSLEGDDMEIFSVLF